MSRGGTKPFYYLMAGNLVIVMLIFGVAAVVSYRSLNAQYMREVEAYQHQLTEVAKQYVEHLWPLPDAEMDRVCKQLGPAGAEAEAGAAMPVPAGLPIRLTVIAADGRVLGDSQGDPAVMLNHKTNDRPEVVQALDGRPGQDTRPSATLTVPFRYVALPVKHEGATVGAVRSAMPEIAITQAQTVIRSTVAWTAVMALVAFALVGLLVNWVWYQEHKRSRPPASSGRRG